MLPSFPVELSTKQC